MTKLDLVDYYLAVADGALRAIGGRPLVLKRYVDGIDGEGFYQKRAPAKRPDWVNTVELAFPSGRTAHELVISERAQLVWITNLGNIDLHPHPVRADDLDHPDELRIDLDPGPGVGWQTVREVAQIVREVLTEHGLTGWPKTTGSRGLHVYVRLHRECGFGEVRPGGAGGVARSGAARTGSGDQQVVEGGARRGVPGLQPERQGSHGGRGLLGAPAAGGARIRSADLGRGARLRAGRLHHQHDAGPAPPSAATWRLGLMPRPAVLPACWSWPSATRRRVSAATHRGRPTSGAGAANRGGWRRHGPQRPPPRIR